jgi:acetyltransferase-like isoleucine patch superfamily enzyme
MDLLAAFRALLAELRQQQREKHRRFLPAADLLEDRWQRARAYGFGEGSSCYDNVLVLGEVSVGRNCWIGPNVVLDGSGGLSIGDHVDISAGAQLYSHNTVARATSGGIEPIAYAPTRIGSRVYIGPQAVVAMGVTIGEGAVIGALSLVNADVPAGARVWGIPARVQG